MRKGGRNAIDTMGGHSTIYDLEVKNKRKDRVMDNSEAFGTAISEAHDMLECIPADASRIELVRGLRPVLVLLAQEGQDIAAAFFKDFVKERFSLTGKEISEFLAECDKIRKEEWRRTAPPGFENSRGSKYSASFPGLVDVVEHEGLSWYLVKESGGLILKECMELGGITYWPPPLDEAPFPLPRYREVMLHYEDAVASPVGYDIFLYEDLNKYFLLRLQLPVNARDCVIAWVLHTLLVGASQLFPLHYHLRTVQAEEKRVSERR